MEKIEAAVDRLVPVALFGILIIVVLELVFTEVAHHYDIWINLADTVVIMIFVVDLSFKFHRAGEWEGFLRNHWLEIIAISPLFYVFRMAELIRISSTAEAGQEAAHLAEGARSGRFAQFLRSASIANSTRFGRLVRFTSRAPRFAKAAEFFKSPEEDKL